MNSIGRTLQVRQVPAVLLVTLLCVVLAEFFGRVAVPIKFAAGAREHRIPGVEMIAVVCAVLIGFLARPRLWEWERLGGMRIRLLTAATAAMATVLPLVPLLATIGRDPEGLRWAWLAANILIAAATVQIAVPLLGPLLGGGVVLLLYFGDAVLDTTVPALEPYLPLTPYSSRVLPPLGMDLPGPPAHWELAVVLGLLAVAVNVLTRGATHWARSRGNNED